MKDGNEYEQKSREQPDGSIDQERVAHFGYRLVPEIEKVNWVNRHFNTVADKYDFMNSLLSFGIHHLWKRTTVKMLGLREGNRVLDVCGGTGDLSLLAARAIGASGFVMNYDINRAMLEKGKPKVTASTFGRRISFVQGDAEELSISDECFDAAIVGFGIRNLTHMEQGFKEMHRVLKPGGRLACLEFSIPTAPVFRWLYDVHSFYVMPFLGGLVVGSRDAYRYLPESIRLFPLPDELSTILKRIGFSPIIYRKLTNGISVIHLAIKE